FYPFCFFYFGNGFTSIVTHFFTPPATVKCADTHVCQRHFFVVESKECKNFKDKVKIKTLP
ncbi:MAG: hypothetical protein FWC85_04910, partial [Elusimicrobia bacterium]|nr:hypothetical protein [Elusimicrobiota bacterium]